jgi:hypothetical protein
MALEFLYLLLFLGLLLLVRLIFWLVINPSLVNKEDKTKPSTYFKIVEKLTLYVFSIFVLLKILKYLFSIELQSPMAIFCLNIFTFIVFNFFFTIVKSKAIPKLKYPYIGLAKTYSIFLITASIYIFLGFVVSVIGMGFRLFTIPGLSIGYSMFEQGAMIPTQYEVFDDYLLRVNAQRQLKVYKKTVYPFAKLIYQKDTTYISPQNRMSIESRDSIEIDGSDGYILRKGNSILLISTIKTIDINAKEYIDTLIYQKLN